ncbi:Radial spoke head 1 [Tetrabaena socialis]|uniref:Radial spoke head 1 n=1 Tax=Tetrabaena socialis TaxID=47790 RepID=A0A2J7ZKS1_9CHLO|nr:Radial spoke head 1 [Tetrabaena socialis]|eukprot:PNH00864.1 Radial spoke head 1 [Tetrabaena socialis]
MMLVYTLPPTTTPPTRAGVYREGDYVYEGQFVEDVIQGRGTFTYASGSKYSGDWQANKYHGKGTYSWPDGRRYDGLWEESRMHGLGVFTDASGHKWEGQFFNGSGPGLTCQL